MFATLIDRYPEVPGTAEERLLGVLGDQLDAGLGMLTDGRLHRVTGDPGPAVAAWQAADRVAHHLAAEAGLEPPLVKACLVGPWTLAEGAAHALAVATSQVASTITALIEAGAAVVQVTEPTISAIDADAAAALDRLTDTLAALADVGTTTGGHVSLAVTGMRGTTVPAERLFSAPFASYLFDVITAPDDWRLCARVPTECGLVVGVHDARPERQTDEAVTIWGARYAASMGGRGPMRVGICASAGIERMDRDRARATLAAMAEAGRKAELPNEELASSIDPRAVDSRSAALGRYEPPRRRRANG